MVARGAIMNRKLESGRQGSAMDKFDYLAGASGYFVEGSNPPLATTIEMSIESIQQGARQIDPVGIVEMLGCNCLLGERTLVQHVKRVPWMSRLNAAGSWSPARLPEHGNARLSTCSVVGKLRVALREEALDYLTDTRCVGILLSGGLDSRIVAGVVRELQLEGEFSGDVVGITWGLAEGSRDTAYAKEIAERYNWEWIHLPLGADTLERNIYVAGKLGAEFAPFHLHAIPQVRELENIDVILAGTFGDSIGRGEFSARRVTDLKPTVPSSLNRFGLIRDEIVRANQAHVLRDAYAYRETFQRREMCQYRELERYIHFMRRKLVACMSHVSERVPLFQLFTAPGTFEIMWGLDFGIRDNRFYAALLPTLPGEIGKLPWARTGRPLGDAKEPADNAAKQFHQYGIWLRHDLRAVITRLVLSEDLAKLNIFNERALKRLVKLWPKAKTVSTNHIDEAIAWMASLAVLVKHYNIQSIEPDRLIWRDSVNAFSGIARARAYQAVRGRLRD